MRQSNWRLSTAVYIALVNIRSSRKEKKERSEDEGDLEDVTSKTTFAHGAGGLDRAAAIRRKKHGDAEVNGNSHSVSAGPIPSKIQYLG